MPISVEQAGWQLQLDRALPGRIHAHRGVCHLVEGYCFHPESGIRSLELRVGEFRFPLRWIHEPRERLAEKFAGGEGEGNALLSGFRGLVCLPRQLPAGAHEMVMEVRGTRETVRIPLGSTQIVAEGPFTEPVEPADSGDASMVVCLATYNPAPEPFRRQVESLRAQTFTDWICLVNDDGSDPELYRQVEQICAADPRFQVRRNPRNLGYYHNFEACLARVPPGVRWVAFCDQDDFWYPEKLQRTLDALEAQDALLAYCDMRITDPSGTVLADTYWSRRRNNFTRLDSLILANTVTGAASVFRRELVDMMLPFPDRIGHAFHDHWAACIALAHGRLCYVDEPLYEYVQGDSNVIGHTDFAPRSLLSRGRSLLAVLAAGMHILIALVHTLLFGPDKNQAGETSVHSSLAGLLTRLVEIHEQEYLRLEVTTRSLVHRFPGLAWSSRRAAAIYCGGWPTVWRLLWLHLAIVVRGETTNDAELRLAAAYLAFRVNRLIKRWWGLKFIRRYGYAHTLVWENE
ncbi:MAG: glycosyltransferase [Gammaproteobacteria bacterium]|nr:glycosyltransferase [Gammaproteobacteria bacterium]